MRGALAAAAAAVAVAVAAAPRPAAAQAGDVTVGLYAPTAPFDGSGDRVAFVNAVADHLAGAAGGLKVAGKVYGSAGALAAAIKKGDVQFAVIDAPYAAAAGLPKDARILATATRGGAAAGAWQLVGGAGIAGLRDLRGKKVAVPSTGAREAAFVTNALLGGEVDASYFDAIVEAPDVRSALTMITVGKADAALVPGGVDLPAGVRRVLAVGGVGEPLLVALPGADAALARAFAARARTFAPGRASGPFDGFVDGDAGGHRALAAAFARRAKQGPMALPPPARLSVRELLEGRVFAVPLSDVLSLVEAPPGD